MGQALLTARMVARDVSKALGKDVDAKRVRSWVRDNVAAYDDDGYTAHQYTPALARTIVAGMVKRANAARPTAASNGRKGAAKVAKVAKATAKRKSGQTGRVSATQPGGTVAPRETPETPETPA